MAWVTGQLPEQPRKHRNSALNSGVDATARTICSIRSQASPFLRARGPCDMQRISTLKFPFLLIALALLSGCEKREEKAPAPTEPWRKDEGKPKERTPFLSYRLTAGQKLHFQLPGKKAKPEGRISLSAGSLRFDPDALETASGEIEIDLSSLEVTENVQHSPAQKDTRKESETADETIAPFTFDSAELLRWMNLGEKVPDPLRERHALSKFVFRSARDLSQPAAHLGGRTMMDKESPAETRKVYLTSVGELSLGPYSVHRELPLTVEFHFSEAPSRGSPPDQVDVTLRGSVRVPLSEYQISPRDDAGRVMTDRLSLLGSLIGSSALVSGKVTFLPTR